MKLFACIALLSVCLANVSGRDVREKSTDPVCAFYIESNVSVSDPPVKEALISLVRSLVDTDDIRFNEGTNDVAVFVKSSSDCTLLTTDLAPKVIDSSVFGPDVRLLFAVSENSTRVTARKCTYSGTCPWWYTNCRLYRTCGKGYVSGGVSGAGDLYGKACTSSCRSKCYSYCQCPYDTSCYGKK